MNWKELLKKEIETTYTLTENLLNLVDNDKIDYKPSDENNWMSMGQLLRHLTDACGAPIKGFVTGDWGLPDGMTFDDLSEDEMLPSAAKLPAVNSVAETKKMLNEDKILAMNLLDRSTEEELSNSIARAPWDGSEMILGRRFLQMISHLCHHKVQLFFYLKLQGKKVNTSHLWG